MSLDDFTAWIVGASWNIESTGDGAASQFAYASELALAERSGGFVTFDEFRSEPRTLSREELASSIRR